VKAIQSIFTDLSIQKPNPLAGITPVSQNGGQKAKFNPENEKAHPARTSWRDQATHEDNLTVSR